MNPALRLSAAALVALALGAGLGACQTRSPETTGSIGPAAARAPLDRAEVEALAVRYRENPNDLAGAMRYAQALRATDQKTQAAAASTPALAAAPCQ